MEATLEYSLADSEKVKYKLLHIPAIPLLNIYPREIKIHVLTITCTQMFITAFFTVIENLKQPKMSWIDRQKCGVSIQYQFSNNKEQATNTC